MNAEAQRAEARRFLFLQGPIGPFFAQLATALESVGHSVERVRFNGGDWVFDRSRRAVDFCGDAASWPDFVGQRFKRSSISDLVVFGDCRPLHRLAVQQARALGIRIHVFEEGYIRPGWITLEAEGVNGFSLLPNDAAHYLATLNGDRVEVAATTAAPAMPFARRAAEDVLFTAASLVLAPRYRGYRTHKPWSPVAEYRAGAKRFFARPRQHARAAAAARALLDSSARFFLFPLQLDSDAQIRVHSDFGRMAPAIESVVRSFAAHAPADVQLVISEHPLDQAVVDLHDTVAAVAAATGISDRIVYLRGGTPPPLLAACCGVVTVNSTIGLSAMEAGRPVATLGKAVYNIAGLVDDRPLEHFWSQPRSPDAVLLAAFRLALIQLTQLPGGYYGPEARRLAVDAAFTRLSGAFQPPPATRSDPTATSVFSNARTLPSDLDLSPVK